MNYKKRIEKLQQTIKITHNTDYAFTINDWNIDDIKNVLFTDVEDRSLIDKWNNTDWGDNSCYLSQLSIPELKRLEEMLEVNEL